MYQTTLTKTQAFQNKFYQNWNTSQFKSHRLADLDSQTGNSEVLHSTKIPGLGVNETFLQKAAFPLPPA